ncbi:MAG: RelA/SpoT family protein [Bacteroidota bacterium]
MPEVLDITADELLQIDSAYAEMINSLRVKYSEEDNAQMQAAFELAKESHWHQRRKSGEPYILHPIAVARICAEEIGLGPTAICSALLHDVVEDTPITLDDIEAQFGERIATMVNGLTKLEKSTKEESQQAANFKKVLFTLTVDVRIVLIKMADRLHNMRTLGSMPVKKQFKIAAETSYVYAPLAHRLGLYAIRSEFLDLCMKILDREDYDAVARKLQETKKSREEFIDTFTKPIIQKLDAEGIKYRATGRPKSIYSIYNKLKKKQVPFEEIYDLFAVRFILDVPPEREKSACWHLYSIVTDIYRPVTERLKDWVSVPKANGYESLHTTVIAEDGRFVEVQIRTERMDEIAERGFAAHWKYKGVKSGPDVYERWFSSVRDILDDPNSDTVEFLGDFRANNFFNEEVIAYTPDGDVKMLPKGSTALDFAFSVHSMVGYTCQSVLVNGRIVPLNYELKNGDQVKVNTNKNQKPNQDWLKLVKTGKAKSKIRQAMREERREKGEFGRESLQRRLEKLGVKELDTAYDKLAKRYTNNSTLDLFYGLATEKFTVAHLLKPYEVREGRLEALPEEAIEQPPPAARKRNPANKIKGKAKLLINGEPGDQYDHSLANCCNPVQGDSVFAYVTTNAGMKIHRINCPNAENLMANYGYRILRAEWISTTEHRFVVDLRLTGLDRGKGVIEELSHEISELGLSIRSMNISGEDGFFEAQLSLFVYNTDQLNLAMMRLKALDNVATVERLDRDE